MFSRFVLGRLHGKHARCSFAAKFLYVTGTPSKAGLLMEHAPLFSAEV